MIRETEWLTDLNKCFLPLHHLTFLLSSEFFFSPLSILNIPFFQINYSLLKFTPFWPKTCPLSLHMQVVESGILGQVGRLYPICYLFYPIFIEFFFPARLLSRFPSFWGICLEKNCWDAQEPGIILYIFWNKGKEIQTPILFSVTLNSKMFFGSFLKTIFWWWSWFINADSLGHCCWAGIRSDASRPRGLARAVSILFTHIFLCQKNFETEHCNIVKEKKKVHPENTWKCNLV